MLNSPVNVGLVLIQGIGQIQVAVSNIHYLEIRMLIFRKRFAIPKQRFFIEIIHSQLYSWLNTINHNRKRKKKLTKMINRYVHYRSVAYIVSVIFRIQRMKKVCHQVMHRTQVTLNAIWKHCELRNDLHILFSCITWLCILDKKFYSKSMARL